MARIIDVRRILGDPFSLALDLSMFTLGLREMGESFAKPILKETHASIDGILSKMLDVEEDSTDGKA